MISTPQVEYLTSKGCTCVVVNLRSQMLHVSWCHEGRFVTLHVSPGFHPWHRDVRKLHSVCSCLTLRSDGSIPAA